MALTLFRRFVRQDTHGLGILLDGNPQNVTLSHGHIVRGNHVRHKINPPAEGESVLADIAHAVTVGTEVGSHFYCPARCMSDIVTEDNVVVVKKGNGTCASNGVFVNALYSTATNNSCIVE